MIPPAQLGLFDAPSEVTAAPLRPRRLAPLSVAALATGSSGNCYLVTCGSTRVLVDCGLGPRQLRTRLLPFGLAPEDLDAILLTHGHEDHVSGAAKASLGRIPIHATEASFRSATARIPAGDTSTPRPRRKPLTAGRPVTIGEIEALPVAIPHDWPETFAFVFSDGSGRRAAIATDVGEADPRKLRPLAGCDLLFVEFNHDPELLRAGPYPPFLKQRIAGPGGHLANAEAAGLVPELLGAETAAVVAVHLSRTNNRPAIAAEALAGALDRCGSRAVPHVSLHDRSTPLLSVAAALEAATA